MSKNLRWILLTITFLIVFYYVMISYWRDNTNIDISASTLMIMLIGLPLSILFAFYMVLIFVKFIKNKLTSTKTLPSVDESNTQNEQEDNTSIDLDENILLPVQHLHVLETALITPFGNDIKQIITELKKKRMAEPDPILKYEKTFPYLSQRIPSMPALNDEEKKLFKQETSPLSLLSRPLYTDRAKRIEQITIQLFEKISLVLLSLDIKQLYRQEEIIKSENQARLHPEWILPVDKQNLQESSEIAYRPRPNLQVLYLLPNHISDVEKEILSDLPKQYLKLLDVNEQHDVNFHIDYVESSDETQMIIDKALTKHLNLDHIESPQLLLIMGVDSWIDQLILNIKFDKEKQSVQPSEGGFAILFSDQEITTGINPVASISKPSKYKCHQSDIEPNQRMAENIIQSIEQIQQAYEFNINNKILGNDEFLIVDNKPIHTHSLIDLNSISNHYQINNNQIMSTSYILNDTNCMISGCSLVIAIENTIEKQKKSLLINNAGMQLGTSWVITPPILLIDKPDNI